MRSIEESLSIDNDEQGEEGVRKDEWLLIRTTDNSCPNEE